jgi:hypothetical protein
MRNRCDSANAPQPEDAMSMTNTPVKHYLTCREVAAALRERGIVVSARTPYVWSQKHPGFAVKFGGRLVFPARVVDLISAGIPAQGVPAYLRERDMHPQVPDAANVRAAE